MMTRWLPDQIRSFERFNKMMEEMFRTGEEFRGAWMPTVDIKETPKELTFYVELPGLKMSDIAVEIVGDVLTIRGTREFLTTEKREDYARIERSYGQFQRSFTLDVPVKASEVSAEYKDGVLNVTVPKAENVLPHKIEVKHA